MVLLLLFLIVYEYFCLLPFALSILRHKEKNRKTPLRSILVMYTTRMGWLGSLIFILFVAIRYSSAVAVVTISVKV